LSGAVAADYGFDPLKLSEQPQQFDKYFEAELLHARCVGRHHSTAPLQACIAKHSASGYAALGNLQHHHIGKVLKDGCLSSICVKSATMHCKPATLT
jgi:hypothetical protein